jgi:1-acyl-sn-glycerol-3-phosphate acyltransferase
MFYTFLKYYVIAALRVYFKRVDLTNAHALPLDKPVLLCANHPNSFVDALLLGAFAIRDLHFIVRGDVFLKRYLWFFRWTNQIPIFRFKDGYANLQKNKDSFEYCYRKLAENVAIAIFSEGICVQEKRLRPIQKGTAKMAFGALEANDFALDLQLVPVGLNYTYPARFRSEAMVRYGQPIALSDYLEAYRENPNKAYRLLTQELEKRMAEQLVIIEKPEDEPLFEFLLPLKRISLGKRPLFPVVGTSDKQLDAEKSLGEQLNGMATEDKSKLWQKTAALQENIEKQALRAEDLLGERLQNANTPFGTLLLLLFAPLFALGALLNMVPYILAKKISKQRVKKAEYFASVFIGVGLVSYLLYMLLIFLAVGFTLGWLYAFGCLVAVPFLGYCAILFKEFFTKRAKHRKAAAYRNKLPAEYKNSISTLQEVMQNFGTAIKLD